jgi:drug/metabolite transporter (DMT)-like permease
MTWILIGVFSYLISAFVSLLDKFVLKSLIPEPKVYAFYVGVIGILVLFIAPFVGFSIMPVKELALALFAGVFFVFGLFFFYKGFKKYEVSRVVSAVGGLGPIFTFLLIILIGKFLKTTETSIFTSQEFLAFLLLVLGSFLISYELDKKITSRSFFISVAAAFFFSLNLVLTKNVFLTQPFWNALIWIKIGSFLAGITFIFFKEVKDEVFGYAKSISKKSASVLFLNQGILSVSAGLLSNWAMFLAPIGGVAILNSLQGFQYLFLFVLTLLFSFHLPKFLKEEISPKIILQKIVAIFVIIFGIAFLYFKFS